MPFFRIGTNCRLASLSGIENGWGVVVETELKHKNGMDIFVKRLLARQVKPQLIFISFSLTDKHTDNRRSVFFSLIIFCSLNCYCQFSFSLSLSWDRSDCLMAWGQSSLTLSQRLSRIDVYLLLTFLRLAQ